MLWLASYKDKVKAKTQQADDVSSDAPSSCIEARNQFDYWSMGTQERYQYHGDDSDQETEIPDELEVYLSQPKASRIDGPSGVYRWWKARQTEFPSLSRMAFDCLAIPAMQAECERVFSRY